MNTNEVMKAVSEVCGCTVDELRSRCRRQHLVAARKIVAVVLRGYTLHHVGRMICRHHATVLFYRRTFDDNVKYDRYLRERYEEVKNRIGKQDENI